MCSNIFEMVEFYFVLLYTLLKPISYLLGLLAEKTESKWDNNVAHTIAACVNHLAWFLGLFGIGDVPKTVRKNHISFKRKI